RLRVAGAVVVVLDIGVIPGHDQVEARDHPKGALAAVAASDERVGWRIHIKALAVLVGAVEPPVETVTAGADRRLVLAASQRALPGQHGGILAVRAPQAGRYRSGSSSPIRASVGT